MKKQILVSTFFCVFCFCVVIFNIKAFAASSGTCGKNLTWSYDETTHTLTISGTGDMGSSFGFSDDGITLAPWRSYYKSMKTVVIGSGVTSISGQAFRSCTGLTSVTIPDSVTSIGNGAFRYCTGLTEINYNAANVADLTSSSDVFRYAGTSGEGINVTFGDSVKKIPAFLFYVSEPSYSPNIKSVTIGKNVTSIGNGAFRYCTGLTEINYNAANATDLTSDVFYNAGTSGEGINVIFGDSVKKIPRLFYVSDSSYRPNIKSVTIGNSVTIIGDYAFHACAGLTSVTIGNSVTSIGNCAFSYCTGLTEINYNAANAADLTYTSNVFRYAGTSGEGINVTFGDSVEKIPANLFYVFDSSSDSANIKSITIGKNVTNIGENAFSVGSGFESITVDDGNTVYHSSGDCLIETESKTLIAGCKNSVIPTDGSVTSIGNFAFYGCTGLTSVTIGNSVTSIGNYAFRYCTGLTSVTIPDSVTSIGDSAFNGCTGLTSITIPDSVTSIGKYAFYGCTGLTSVTIGNSVTSIGDSAFYGCTGLTSVTIGNSVTSIGDSAFYGCTGLTSGTIGNSVTSIGNSAFYRCTGLTSITIPDSVTSIGNSAFYDCTGLTDVYYYGTAENWNIIKISSYNSYLNDATRHYFTEVPEQPISCGPRMSAYSYWSDTEPIEYIVEPEILAGTGLHTPSATPVKVNSVAPTCTEPGHYDNVYYCSVCGEEARRETITVPATGHDWFVPTSTDGWLYFIMDKQNNRNKEPTCIENGCRRYRCRNDKSHYYDEIIPATGHTFHYFFDNNATCTFDGTETEKCLTCGRYGNTIAAEGTALGHSFTNYAYNCDATETSDGTKTAKCDRCAETNTVVAIGTRKIDSLKNAKLTVSKSQLVNFGSSATLNATATGVPEDYYLIIYEGNRFVAKGDNKSVSCVVEDITEDRVFTVKIADRYGNTKSAANTQKTVTVKVQTGFIYRLIEFFKKLFSIIPLIKQTL